MRRLLPLFFLFIFLFSSFCVSVNAQSPTSILNQTTVHSQDPFADFFAWLGDLLFKNQIPKKVCIFNLSGLPVNALPGENCDSSQTVSAQADGQSAGSEDSLKKATRQYYTASNKNIPFNPEENSQNFFDKLLADLKIAVPVGNEKATKFAQSNLPFGVEVLPTQSDQNSAMAYALDCKKDSTLPVGANPDSKCIPANQPVFESPTPIPTVTPTPVSVIYPPGGGSYDSCPVGNDKCISKVQQEAGKFGDPDYYRRNKCYWGNFLPAFNGNEVKARAASAICFRESGGDVINVNDHCLSTYPINYRTEDYSVGLFQINLLAHCPGALRDDWYTLDPTTNQPMRSCTILDQVKLNACYAQFTTFDGAVAKMLELSKNGTDWHDWLTHHPEKYCEVTNDQMMCVAPSVTPAVPYTPPSGNYVYYSQKDYSATPYGYGCTIYNSGCGPTTLAMILSTYLGTSWTPPIVASTLLSSQSCQTSPYALNVALNSEGFRSNLIYAGRNFILSDADKASIKSNLANGAIILAGANMSWFETRRNGVGCNCVKTGGHYFWIVDIDASGSVIVMDPWYGAGRPHPIAQQNINSYPVYYKHMIVAYPPGK